MPEEDSLHQQPTVDAPQPVSDPGTIEVTSAYEPDSASPAGAVRNGAWPVIAGYEITSEIARGGMGRVLAGRDLTLDREVAIKTLLPGADVERFVTESKITARLPHPGIPPVHALGSLAEGSRYLVMKLIRGRTLAVLLNERKSAGEDLSRWVQVFEQIAQAVGFAHTQGIIHRDLKPLNVMVGAFGEVQVMDWGIAKELQIADCRSQMDEEISNRGSERTLTGTILGTPGYMSPEQARGEAVDARADVFALGAILTVILTGKPTFFGTTVRETIDKTAAGRLGDAVARLDASGADSELVALAKNCLAARAADRPADARTVADQVAAYRAGVETRLRQAETDRAAALVREGEQRKRRRLLLASAGLVAAVLLAGIVGTTVGLLQAREEAGLKETALANEKARADGEAKAKLEAMKAAEAEGLAKRTAESAAELERLATQKAVAAAAKESHANAVAQARFKQVEKVNSLLQSIFTDINPRAEQKGGPLLLDQLCARLVQTADAMDEPSSADPETAARLQTFLGNTLAELGEPKKALAIHEKVRATREKLLGPDHPDTIASMHNLAYSYQAAGLRDKALVLYEQTLQKRKARLGPDDPATLTTMNNLAIAYQNAGQLAKAMPLYEESLAKRVAKLGPDHPDTLTSMGNMAYAYQANGQRDKAVSLYEQTVTTRIARLGPEHPDTLTCMNNLAHAYHNGGQPDKALRLYEETLEKMKGKLGPDHPITLTSMNNLAASYQKAGQPAKAIALHEETLAKRKAKLGPDHPDTLGSLNNLAHAYQAVGKWGKATPLYEEALQKRRAILGPDHPETQISVNNLAIAYKDAGQWDKAFPLFDEHLQKLQARLGPDHADTLTRMNEMAFVYQAGGHRGRARPLYEEILRRRKATLGPDHADTLASMRNLALTYTSLKETAKAVPLFNEYLAVKRKEFGSDDQRLAEQLTEFGIDLFSRAEHAAAEPLLRESLKIRLKTQPDAWATSNTQVILGATLYAQKKYQDAGPLLKDGYEGVKAREKSAPADGKGRVSEALLLLVRFHEATGNAAEAARYRKELAARKKDNEVR